MRESVVPSPDQIEWDPNAPEAVLVYDEQNRAFLALNSYMDDEDTRCVVFCWNSVHHAQMSGPNDEARSGHRLYNFGLSSLLWMGIVECSSLMHYLERQNSVHERHDPRRFEKLVHYILPLKEGTVEVLAESLTIRRLGTSTREAAIIALNS